MLLWFLLCRCVALRLWMLADILRTSWDQCVSRVQCCLMSTAAIRLVRTKSPRQLPRLSVSHSSWAVFLLWWSKGFYTFNIRFVSLQKVKLWLPWHGDRLVSQSISASLPYHVLHHAHVWQHGFVKWHVKWRKAQHMLHNKVLMSNSYKSAVWTNTYTTFWERYTSSSTTRS